MEDLLKQTPGDFNIFKWLINFSIKNPLLYIAVGLGIWFGIRDQSIEANQIAAIIICLSLMLIGFNVYRKPGEHSFESAIVTCFEMAYCNFAFMLLHHGDVRRMIPSLWALTMSILIFNVMLAYLSGCEDEGKKGPNWLLNKPAQLILGLVRVIAWPMLILGAALTFGINAEATLTLDSIAVFLATTGLSLWMVALMVTNKHWLGVHASVEAGFYAFLIYYGGITAYPYYTDYANANLALWIISGFTWGIYVIQRLYKKRTAQQ